MNMALTDRLMPYAEDRIPLLPFASALAEMSRGLITRDQVIAGFRLTAAEWPQLDSLIAKMNAVQAANRFKYALEFNDVLNLCEVGVAYTTPQALAARLGL
jgi:hypothetical protein